MEFEKRTSGDRVVAIIQGRMGSSRLPGKVLKDIAGKSMLAHVVERTARAQSVDAVMVATTDEASDDPIAQACVGLRIACYRGSQYDVLDRFYQAALQAKADVIVRITADCPLIDPQVIDLTVAAFYDQQADFAANRLPPPFKRTYPIGLDTEVCSFAALQRAWREASAQHEREHVMPYLYEEDGRFKVALINAPEDYGHLRWTVDTPEDLEELRAIFALLPDPLTAGWLDVLRTWQAHPEIQELNAAVEHKTMFDIDKRGL